MRGPGHNKNLNLNVESSNLIWKMSAIASRRSLISDCEPQKTTTGARWMSRVGCSEKLRKAIKPVRTNS